MKRTLAIAAAGLVAPLLAFGAVHAAAPDAAAKVRPSTVAVAIGALTESDGGKCTVDFRGATRAAATHGALRFYCPDDGYYNGGVKTLSVTGGAISATGQGGFTAADGTRSKVQYTAQISADGQSVTITVTGVKENYTLTGRLDGLVRAGAPVQKTPVAKASATPTPAS